MVKITTMSGPQWMVEGDLESKGNLKDSEVGELSLDEEEGQKDLEQIVEGRVVQVRLTWGQRGHITLVD